MNQITKKTTSKLVSIQSLKTFSNNKLSKIAIFAMKCTVIFVLGDARPKNSLVISNFTIFESLLFEGYSCKRLQTLYSY
jgi:hypothetical protein